VQKTAEKGKVVLYNDHPYKSADRYGVAGKYTRDASKYCGNWKRAAVLTGATSVDACETACAGNTCHSGYHDADEQKCYLFGGTTGSADATCNHNTARATVDGVTRFTATNQVTLKPLTPMAPQHLIDRAKDFDHSPMSMEVAGSADDLTMPTMVPNEGSTPWAGWNVIGFEGGGSSIEYTTSGFGGGTAGITGSEYVITKEEDRDEFAWAVGVKAEGDTSFTLGGVGVDFGVEASLGGAGTTSGSVNIVTTTTDDSTARFTLADPEGGDYFVVSLYSDPDFGVPLFSLDGGASSCQWEVGTAHRSQPTLSWEYLGADVLAPDEPAMFRVVLKNELSYYPAGPESKWREGWMGTDTGYVAPDLEVMLVPNSLDGGLVVQMNGGVTDKPTHQVFEEFGKGTYHMLVSASRGPYKYVYQPFSMLWREHCGNGANGENKYSERVADPASGIPYYALGMPNPKREIVWTEACPAAKWSGKLLEHPHFAVLAAGDNDAVPVQVHLASGRKVLKAFMEHRTVSRGGHATPWRDTESERVGLALSHLADGTSLATGAWKINRGTAIDGTYEIRVVAECTAEVSTSPFDTSTTGTIRGDVDVTRPSLLAFTSTSLAETFSAGDHFTLLFSEPVVCSGYLADGKTTPKLKIQINYKGGSLTTDSGELVYACHGNEVRLGHTGLAVGLVASGVEVVVYPGIYDVAGNLLTDDAGGVKQPLKNSRAAVERGEVRSKLDGLAGQSDRQSASIKAEVGAASNTTQDLVLNLKSDVKSQMDALNQSNQQSNTEMKGAIASLATMVASLLQASGVETVQFPTCAGPALYSFGRYIKARVPRSAATPAAAATAATCADRCLKVPACTAFSFSAGDGCRLANRDLGTDYDFNVRSRLHVRLTECTK